jgi:outer membrane lipoprotein SlyB
LCNNPKDFIMRTLLLAPALLLLGACATDGYAANDYPRNRDRGYYNGDTRYASYDQCMAAKRRAKTKGAVVGGVGGAVTGAVVGGNLGETALAAGVGALAGGVIGKNSRRC